MADVQKIAVYDSRIVQKQPAYAVQRGGLSVSNATFNAISATPAQHLFQILVPSENIYVDRNLQWSAGVNMTMQYSSASASVAPVATVTPAGGFTFTPLCVPGRDFALCSQPLNSLVSVLQATINDTSVAINTGDIMREVLLCCNSKENRRRRVAPSAGEKYQRYDDAFGTSNNLLGAYNNGALDYERANGSFAGLQFTDSTGNALINNHYYSTASVDTGVIFPAIPGPGAMFLAMNGVPCGGILANVIPALTAVSLFIKFTSTESLVLSPFKFSDTADHDTGLFGINTIQIIANMLPSPARVLRTTSRNGVTLSGVAYNPAAQGGVFTGSAMNCQFITPALENPIPAKSVVEYMEFSRYISQATNTIQPGAVGQVISQVITLPSIPDMLLLCAKPASYASGEADFYLPLANRVYGAIANPLNITWNNYSGLLSNHTTEELYAMSADNALTEMDWDTWSGKAVSAGGSYSWLNTLGAVQNSAQGQAVNTLGSLVVLRPGKDIALSASEAPGLSGSYVLQVSAQIFNNTTVVQTPNFYIIAVSSGFFESVKGSSRVVKSLLTAQEILAVSESGDRSDGAELKRMVGAGFSWSGLSNVFNKVRDIYQRTKPGVSAIKGALPEGKVKDLLGKIGYGETGGRAKKSLAERLV